MAENPYFAPIENPGLLVEVQPQWHTASLRYFVHGGVFTRRVSAATGLEVPNKSAAAYNADEAKQTLTLLAWRSPTETTFVTSDAALFDALQTASVPLDDGCMVDQRSGLLVLRARGTAVANLLATKAGHGAMPAIGESRRVRFAEIAVLLVKIRPEELLMIVDRIYAPHLMASIRASAADL